MTTEAPERPPDDPAGSPASWGDKLRKNWDIAVAGALAGAALTLVVVFGALALFGGGDETPSATAGTVGQEQIAPEVTSAAGDEAPAPAVDGAVGTSPTNPVPVGETATVDGGWQVTVTGSTPNATRAVLAENQFNDPPPAGTQFYMARVRATRQSADFPLSQPSALGPSGSSYGFRERCGVLPDEFPSDVVPGGTAEGNFCWAIAPGDADGLVMVFDSFNQTVFFALP